MRRDVVVVLNYNGWDDTERCVQSLLGGSPDATIMVVDNGSDTGFPASVVELWPGVVTLSNDRNLGFTGGMNAGLRAALERGGGSTRQATQMRTDRGFLDTGRRGLGHVRRRLRDRIFLGRSHGGFFG